MNFTHIKDAVAKQFKRMSAHELFCTAVEKDALWANYLGSFPQGSNPIFRERTEHDCSCCRQFVRAAGNIVAVIDGRLESIWDVQIGAESAYQVVCDSMSALVKGADIDNRFLTTERALGTDKNFEDTVNGVKTWSHFFARVPHGNRDEKNFVCAGADIGPRLSEARALHDVFLRSLNEISMDAIDTVLELIGQNSLYRGEEHKFAVTTFKAQKVFFDKIPAKGDKDLVAWVNSTTLPASVSKIRNTSIGTLLTDLSEGMEMEGAVRKFEAMVAPANYRRPTALVTKSMVAQAKTKLAELGLTSALERRYATLADVSVNDILFADRNARKALNGDVFDDIAGGVAAKVKSFDKIEEIHIERFLADVLPKATSLEVLVENRHINNLVSLVAPVDPTAGALFKWDNLFSWSYSGDFADSIKERVKKAGGNVTGDLCCRLAWFNYDDLDLHMIEPTITGTARSVYARGAYEISYLNRGRLSPSGGDLDVDMNAGSGRTREPVENIFYASERAMKEGVYALFVHQFRKRETADVGFEVEIDANGVLHRFVVPRAVKQDERVHVAEITYTKRDGFVVRSDLPVATVSKKVWGLDTETFQKVSVAMLSPNHWASGRGAGNRHYFFMLDGCRNEGGARGFYNEFLKSELDAHRKVFEIVGNKMRTDESLDQLSGLGFSSTQKNHLVARVSGAFTRTLRVVF